MNILKDHLFLILEALLPLTGKSTREEEKATTGHHLGSREDVDRLLLNTDFNRSFGLGGNHRRK